MNNTIESIIDKHLNYEIRNQLNSKPGEIHPEMHDLTQDGSEEWKIWLPIDSKVTDEEVSDFEKQIGYKLPGDYITFLKYKHFYELQIAEAQFSEHPVYTWRASLSGMIFGGYPREYLIDKGYIPFASWSDWGCLCFDTNSGSLDNNYEVVLWDHEMADAFSKLIRYSKVPMDFKALLIYLDKEDDEMKKGMNQD